ncbi:MAG TPA: 3-oxoacyl-[acyl-carrier-protein] synthase III C-terminal domain-containing protein, partial [Chthoniobacteraceae bacterium]
TLLDGSRDQITWEIGPSGFEMHLSSRVPNTIGSHILEKLPGVLGGRSPETIRHWAIHPGGSSVLDAVQNVLHLPDESLRPSREVLRQYGNMSSATIMFVLRDLLLEGGPGPGCAVGFGPGMAVESMTFSIAK